MYTYICLFIYLLTYLFLQERIERLKNEFVQTEKFIERELIEQEEREKRQLLKEKRESSEEREGQVQTLQHSGKKPTKFIITQGSFTESYYFN